MVSAVTSFCYGAEEKILCGMEFGGKKSDTATAVELASDGGYVFTGSTETFGAGKKDIWVVKLDTAGRKQWAKLYGDTRNEVGESIVRFSDNGYILAGHTDSHGAGATDLFIIRLDIDGNNVWVKTFGGECAETAAEVVAVDDDSFVVAGTTCSYGQGGNDIWLLKMDGEGNNIWSYSYGGEKEEEAAGIMAMKGGGYVVFGTSDSRGDGSKDGWVFGLDSEGKKTWDKTFGGKSEDMIADAVATEAGILFVGSTESKGNGGSDVWVFRTDMKGDILWEKTYGDGGDETGVSVVPAGDGYYVASKWFSDIKTGEDMVLIKIDGDGGEQWRRTYGGAQSDVPVMIIEAENDRFIVAGTIGEYAKDKAMNAWIVKVDRDGKCSW